jgi:CRP-like cAMP-binding protein
MEQTTIIGALTRITMIPDQEQQYFLNQIIWKHVKKGQFLIHAGDSCESIYYCEEGLFRMFYENEEGSEHIKSFVTAGKFFTDYRSLLTAEPAFLSIQALEDSRVSFFSKAVIQLLYERHACWERFGRKLAEELFISKSRKERELVELTAEERYRLFKKQYPDLESRVPQHQIAAFLAINPVSLSRIRGKR